MNLRESIESLREDLHRLSLASASIRGTIERLEQQELGGSETHHTQEEISTLTTTDSDGMAILLGCRVSFLTIGRHKYKGVFVIRFSRNKERVFVVDVYVNEIARAPRSVRVVV